MRIEDTETAVTGLSKYEESDLVRTASQVDGQWTLVGRKGSLLPVSPSLPY